MRVLFPRPAATPVAMLLNTAGGVTGGDVFEVTARASEDARLTVTTQAAERAYRAMPGTVARIANRIEAASGSRIDWLPQETILYDGSALRRHLRVDLGPGWWQSRWFSAAPHMANGCTGPNSQTGSRSSATAA